MLSLHKRVSVHRHSPFISGFMLDDVLVDKEVNFSNNKERGGIHFLREKMRNGDETVRL